MKRVVFFAILYLGALAPAMAQPTFTSNPISTGSVGNEYNYSISGTDPNGLPLSFSAPLLPSWLNFSAGGKNTVTNIGGAITSVGGIANDANGYTYAVNNTPNGFIYRISPDGNSMINNWASIANGGSIYSMNIYNGCLYLSYYTHPAGSSRITKIDLNNPSAGETLVYDLHELSGLLATAFNGGFMYVANFGANKVQKINLSDGSSSDFVTGLSGPYGLCFDFNNHLLIAEYNGNRISKFDGTTLSTGIIPSISGATDIELDNGGYLYVSSDKTGIRKYNPGLSSYTQLLPSSKQVWGMSLNSSGVLVFGINNDNICGKIQTGAIIYGTPAIRDIGNNPIKLRISNGSKTVDQDFTIVVSGPPTISFPDFSSGMGEAPFTITQPVSNSSGIFSYASSNPMVATITGNTITINGVGTSVITATQAAYGFYYAATASATLTVSTNTAPTISNIGAQSLCSGFSTAPLAFTVGDAQTASSNLVTTVTSGNQTLVPNNAIVLGGSLANRFVTVTPVAGLTGTVLITLTVKDAGGLTTSTSFNLTVNPVPTVAAISGNQQLCVSTSSVFSNATAGGIWNTANNNIASINASGLVSGLTAGATSINYTVTNSSGCQATVSMPITVYPLPGVESIDGAETVCIGNTTAFSCSTSGGVWTSNQPGIATVNANGVVSSVSIGIASISYTVTNANGCVKTVSKDITVTAPPAIAPITGNQSVCIGSVSSFSSATAGGIWGSNNTNIATISSSGLVMGIGAGSTIISYTVTNGNGCSATLTKDVTINDRPAIASITGNKQVCAGSSISLNNATPNGAWSSGNTSIATVNSSGILSGAAPGNAIISYTVTNANGCSAAVSKDVTVNALPVVPLITASGPLAFCAGGSVTLTSNGAGSNQWYKDNELINGANASAYTASIGANYTVVTTNAFNCSVSSSATTVTVNANPTAIIGQGSQLAFSDCNNSNINLTANAGAGFSYQWMNDAGPISNAIASNYLVTVPGNYSVRVTNANNCSSISAITNIQAVPSANINGATTVCAGTAVALSANAGNFSNPMYQWMKDGVAISNATNPTFSATFSGKYAVMVSGAGNLSTSCPVNITVNPLPTVSITANPSNTICAGTPATVIANAPSANSFQWLNSDIVMSNATGSSLNIVTTGTYSVRVTDINGCKNTSSGLLVTVNQIPVIAANTGTASVTVNNTSSLFNGTAGGVWSSSNTAVATVGLSGIVTGRSAGTATINYTVTNSGGCTAASSTAFTVFALNAKPVITAAGPLSFCSGGSVVLNSSATSGNQWYLNGTAIGGATGTSYAATASGSYTLSVLATDGITASLSDATIVTVYNNPVAAIQQSSQLATGNCGNTSIVLSSAGTGLSAYQWSNANGIIPGATSAQYIVTQPGNYTLKVTDQNHCSGLSATAKILTIPSSSVSGTTVVCAGTVVPLTANTSGFNNPVYQWKLGQVDIANANASTYYPTASGTYSVTISEGNLSTVSCPISITINPLPAATITSVPNAAVCSGMSINLTSSAAATYQWLNAGNPISGANNINFNATVSGQYSVRITDANGCTNTSAVTNAIVNTVPTVAPLQGNETICAGSTGNFTSATQGGIWSSDNNNIVSVDASGTLTGLSAGTARINYSVSNSGCTTTVSKLITVNANTTISTQPAAQITQCVGTSATIGVGATGTNISYQWYFNGSPIMGATNAIYSDNNLTAADAGSYNVVVSGACINAISATSIWTVNPGVAIVNQPVSSINQCVAASASINVTASGNNLNYQWSRNGIAIAGANKAMYVDDNLSSASDGDYSVFVSGSCSVGVNSSVSVWKTIPVPVVSPIQGAGSVCLGTIANYTNASPGGVWSANNAGVALINTGGVLSPLTAGSVSIKYTVTNASGCVAFNTKDININSLPIVAPISGTSSVCVGSSVNFSSISAGGVWTSNNNAIATVNSNGDVTGIANGTAMILYTVTNANGCSAPVSKDISVITLPIVTAVATPGSVSKGLTVQLQATGSGLISFNWTPSINLNNANIANPVARVIDTATFTVVAKNTQGCIASSSVKVNTIDDMHVTPGKLLTPNGDGINDVFVIKNLDAYPNNKLQVFDRTGKLIFEKENYANDWNALINGKQLIKDTYFYVLSVRGQIVKKGSITIINSK